MTISAQTQPDAHGLVKGILGLVYAWSGVGIMWCFWLSFAVFLSSPSKLASYWPLPFVDRGGAIDDPLAAALIDILLIALFGLQHSLMARPWFKRWWAASIPPAFERCTYVHMANIALFAMIICWQPIPVEVWTMPQGLAPDLVWAVFALGWIVLFLGARSFGLLDLLGVEQMHRWSNGEPPRKPRLKTGLLYRFLRHPMYVGVLLAVWATPRMTVGHALLALGMTGYVLIAMRYEERDLVSRFGASYNRWRAQALQ
jgi:methanethiol S-methyltransferase